MRYYPFIKPNHQFINAVQHLVNKGIFITN